MKNSLQKPLISIVMPVHNALPHLDEAISSILEQTYANFEYIIYDDCSTDGSFDRLREWAGSDPRIKLFRGTRNLGPAASSNRVIRHSSGELIARMDADDVSHPDRLKRQLEVLTEHSDVGLVGTLCDVIDANDRNVRGPELWRLTRKSWVVPFPHGSIMFRRKVFEAVGGYRDQCEFWEDLDFVLRVAKQSRIMVMPSPLYMYRQSDTSTRIASDQVRVERAVDLRYRSVARIQQNRNYDGVLLDQPSDRDTRVDPRVFISLGSLVLWSNRRPKFVRRLLRRGRLSFDLPTATAMIWTLWAETSPWTLRATMQMVSRIRSAAAKRSRLPDTAVEWATPN